MYVCVHFVPFMVQLCIYYETNQLQDIVDMVYAFNLYLDFTHPCQVNANIYMYMWYHPNLFHMLPISFLFPITDRNAVHILNTYIFLP